jgi:hypothetical protein
VINWETIAAVAVTLSALGGFFLFVVRLLISGFIRDAVNGFKTQLALVQQRQSDSQVAFDKLYDYAHGTYHDTLNKITEAQLEAFRSGKEAGRSLRREETTHDEGY